MNLFPLVISIIFVVFVLKDKFEDKVKGSPVQ